MRFLVVLLIVILFAFAVIHPVAIAQKAATRAPTAADWAALGKLPDFTGVWEISRGGAGGRGAAGHAARRYGL